MTQNDKTYSYSHAGQSDHRLIKEQTDYYQPAFMLYAKCYKKFQRQAKLFTINVNAIPLVELFSCYCVYYIVQSTS